MCRAGRLPGAQASSRAGRKGCRLQPPAPSVLATAGEVCAAAGATFEFLHLPCVADGAGGMPPPEPAILGAGNTTAECFVNNTAFKSKLKHIDVRQHWVRTLRDKSIITPQHVNTNDNLADIFTKTLCGPTFTKLRDQLMVLKP